MEEGERLYTVPQAGEVLGLSRQRVLVLCNDGRMGRKIGERAWIITQTELDRVRGELAGELRSAVNSPGRKYGRAASKTVAEAPGEYSPGLAPEA